jgi:hypothetical protein
MVLHRIYGQVGRPKSILLRRNVRNFIASPELLQHTIHSNQVNMGLSSRQDLNIVELVYYGISIPLIAFILVKQGFGRQIGWFYLAVLAILRIVGASTGLAYESNPSQGLIEASLICYSVGISPLLLSLLGILKRINEGMKGHGVAQKVEMIIQLPILVGLILGIVAGTKEFSNDASTRSSGYDLFKAAVILYILALLALAAVCFQTFARRQWILEGEMRLLAAGIISLPFLLVRIIYSITSAFSQGSTTFSITSDRTRAVVVEAIMSVAMEFIVVALFIAAGLTVRPIPRSMVKSGYVDSPQYDAGVGGKASQEYPLNTNGAHQTSAV